MENILILGDAGTGKTKLMEDILKNTTEERFYIVHDASGGIFQNTKDNLMQNGYKLKIMDINSSSIPLLNDLEQELFFDINDALYEGLFKKSCYEKTVLFIKTSKHMVSEKETSLINELIKKLWLVLDECLKVDDILQQEHLPITFLIDEMQSFPLIADFEELISNSSIYKLNFVMAFQNIIQANTLYGEKIEEITSCCHQFIYLGGCCMKTMDWVNTKTVILGNAKCRSDEDAIYIDTERYVTLISKNELWKKLIDIQSEERLEDINKELKELEESLLSEDKAFGLLTTMGYYNPETEADVYEYTICTVLITDNRQRGLYIGKDLWISKDKEIRVSAEDLVKVFELFRKHKRELICDLNEDVNTFSMTKYIERIRRLDVGLPERRQNTSPYVAVKAGEGTEDGEPTWYLEYDNWCGESYINTKPTESEIEFFKDGIRAERNRIYDMLPGIIKSKKVLQELDRILYGEKEIHDCKHCIYGGKPELGCSNREEAICVKELKIGDKIQFFDSCGGITEIATIKSISKTLNFDFEERWGINGLYVTNIKILNR